VVLPHVYNIRGGSLAPFNILYQSVPKKYGFAKSAKIVTTNTFFVILKYLIIVPKLNLLILQHVKSVAWGLL
jgi:hypothetical protein